MKRKEYSSPFCEFLNLLCEEPITTSLVEGGMMTDEETGDNIGGDPF